MPARERSRFTSKIIFILLFEELTTYEFRTYGVTVKAQGIYESRECTREPKTLRHYD